MKAIPEEVQYALVVVNIEENRYKSMINKARKVVSKAIIQKADGGHTELKLSNWKA